MRTLILLAEAPGDPPEAQTDNPGEPGNKGRVETDPTAKPEKDAADEKKVSDDTGDDFDANADFDDDGEADDLDGEDSGTSDAATTPNDAPSDNGTVISERLRREKLYDAILETQKQAEELLNASNVLIDRLDDEKMKLIAVRTRNSVSTVVEQCETVRKYFSDLGYDKVRELYTTLRERVSAAAEIIKHVIDGDDDFRKPDSGENGN